MHAVGRRRGVSSDDTRCTLQSPLISVSPLPRYAAQPPERAPTGTSAHLCERASARLTEGCHPSKPDNA